MTACSPSLRKGLSSVSSSEVNQISHQSSEINIQARPNSNLTSRSSYQRLRRAVQQYAALNSPLELIFILLPSIPRCNRQQQANFNIAKFQLDQLKQQLVIWGPLITLVNYKNTKCQRLKSQFSTRRCRVRHPKTPLMRDRQATRTHQLTISTSSIATRCQKVFTAISVSR